MVLDKRSALGYLASKTGPVTAKALAIDLDSRTSTASELLERMTAQGLVERDPNQRPREYRLTEAGRELLQSWPQGTSREAAPSDSASLAVISHKLDALAGQLTSFQEETMGIVGDLVATFSAMQER